MSSRAANAGSEGWEPRSNATLQSSSGDCSPNGREMTVGSSFVVSTAAIISSGEPSSDRSASNGWVTDSGAVQVCALSMPMRKSASDHDHSFSLECPETVQPDSSHVMSGDQRSTSSALSESYTIAISCFESPSTSTITGVERMMSTLPRLTSQAIFAVSPSIIARFH